MTLRLSVASEDLDSSLKKAIGIATTFQVAGIRLNTRSELSADNVSASALRQTLLYVKERRMQVAGLICPTRHALYDAEYLEPRIQTIRNSMSLARKLETSELVIRCGRVPDDRTDDKPAATAQSVPDVDQLANPFSFAARPAPTQTSPENQFALLCEILNDLAQHGNHVGCVLNLMVAGYDIRLLTRLLSCIKTGPVNVCFDPATAVMTGANTVQIYRDLYQHVGYVRARDALKDVDGAGIEVPVGDGVVDWIQLLPTLEEANYRGWMCIERSGGENRRHDVERGVSLLKTMIPQTGN